MEGLESFFTSGQQLQLFLLSCAFGIPIGIVFDIFRVLRMIIHHNKIAATLEDILFFCLYGIFLMCFTISMARSEFRFYYCFGNLIGFTLYYVTLGSAVTKILRKIINFIKKILLRIFRPLIKKFALICEKIRTIFVGSLQNIKSHKKNSETLLIDNGNLVYNSNKVKKNKRKNVKKFGVKGIKKKTKKRNI